MTKKIRILAPAQSNENAMNPLRAGTAFQLASIRSLATFLFVVAIHCVPACGLTPDRRVSQYGHTAWRIQDGYLGARPSYVTQTKDGYVWIGTLAGVIRFDGVNFVPWIPSDGSSLPSAAIDSLLGTSDGSLWIGTSRGLAHWKNNKLTIYPDIRGAVLEMVEDKEGGVWLVNDQLPAGTAPCHILDTATQCFGAIDGLSNLKLSLARDDEGNLWLPGTSILRWKPGTPKPQSFQIPRSGPELDVRALTVASDGSVWIGATNLGLKHLVAGFWKPLGYPGFDSDALDVSALFQDREGALWVGTLKHGIYRILGSDVDHFAATDGLSDNNVHSFYEDREGNLWVVTADGVDCFHNNKIMSYSAPEGLDAPEIYSVLATREGSIWVGGYEALLTLPGGNLPAVDYRKRLLPEEVRGLFEDHAGRVWLGLRNRLVIFEKGKFTNIDMPDGQPIRAAAYIAEDTEGSIWVVSGEPRLLLRLHDRKVQQEIGSLQLVNGRPMVADPNGGLWFGLAYGDLGRYRNGVLQTFRFGQKSQARIRQLDVGPDGTVLAAANYGLAGWRRGQHKIMTVQDGLPCNEINSVIRDHQNDVWLFSECALIEIPKEAMDRWWITSGEKVKLRVFDSYDGARPGHAPFSPSSMSPDGRLWFANNTVLQMVDPAHLEYNSIRPPVHIEGIIADRKSYSPREGLRLPPLLRDLEINYTALSFVTPKKMLFRYKLENHDAEWQEAGTRRQAFYTDLPPGHYRFHVIACNNDGVWNETGDALNFSIAPTFYQTAWFRMVLFVLAAGVLWLFYFFRLQRATEQIQERLGARMEERERIARELHDTLLQGFQGLMLRFQAAMKTLPAEAPARTMMEQVLDRADEVLLEGRQSVRDLREEGTTGTELSDALLHCGEELALGHNSRFTLAVVGEPRSVGPVVFNESYRIGREALINTFQHSQATKIEAEITYNEAGLCIRVRDNGMGIDHGILSRGRAGHWGLSGMRERANKIGAQINIWSNSGSGTEVELTVSAKVAFLSSGRQTLWQRIQRVVKRPGEAAL